MNILEKYPEANHDQKQQLLKAQEEWEQAVIVRGDPPYTRYSLDGVRDDYYADITNTFQSKIKSIMKIVDK